MMVKKSTAIKSLSGKRLMTKEVMNYLFEMGSPAALWTKEKNGYKNLTGATGQGRFIYAETYFDLSGYSRNYLTIFPNRITVQEGGSFRLKEDNASVRVGMVVLDIITEERMDTVELNRIVNQVYTQESCPSFALGPQEFSQVIFGRYRMFGRDNAIWTPLSGNLTILNQTQFGSGSPTTAMKLWIYRMIMPLGELAADVDDYIVVPPARYVMSITVDEESDSSFMMRQKKSYELAVE